MQLGVAPLPPRGATIFAPRFGYQPVNTVHDMFPRARCSGGHTPLVAPSWMLTQTRHTPGPAFRPPFPMPLTPNPYRNNAQE